MNRASSVCAEPGCAELVPSGRCPRHQLQPWAGSTRRSRLPRNWSNRIVPRIMRRDGRTCQQCGAPATDVDHIVNGDDHGDLNLRALCRKCHGDKTSREAAIGRANRRSSSDR